MKYNEIYVLFGMLKAKGIPCQSRILFDGIQVCYPSSEKCILSAVQHNGSYGADLNKIEIMGLLTDDEKENDSVVGYLTAENVFNRIEKHYKNNGGES